MPHSLVILGAGPCGLAAARELTRRGERPLLVERAVEPGGLARTFRLGGHRMDLSIHRVQDAALARELSALAGPLHRVRRKTIHVHLDGRRLPYPLGLAALPRLEPRRLLRVGADWLRQRVGAKSPPGCYAEWFVQRFGDELHRWIGEPLMRKQWGIADDRLSVAFARHRRISASVAQLIPGLASREIPVSFLHGQRGAGELMQALARAALDGGATLHASSRPTHIVHDGRRVQHIELSSGARLDVDRVISTIPLPELVRRLDPPLEALLPVAGALRFRALVVVGLALRRQRVGPDHVTYFPEARFPFSRTFEPKNAAPRMAPPGRTLIGFELPCFVGDATWTASDDELARQMARFGPDVGFSADEVEGSLVHREPEAYPLYELGFERRVEGLLGQLHQALENLFVVGRNGLFRLDNMHHAWAMGRDVARHVAAGGEARGWQAGLQRYAALSYID